MQSEHKKTIFAIILAIFLVTTVFAQLTFKQSEEVDIKIVCINAGFCTASAQCNVSIFSPTEKTILDGVQATQAASLAFYNITLNSTQTEELGEYTVGGFCKDGSVTQIVDFNFDITKTGTELSTSRAILHFVLLIGVLGVFLLTLWGAIILPMKNPRGGLDEIVAVDFLKYFKLGLMFISYTLLVWVINLFLSISNNFLLLTQFNGFFTMIFVILRAFMWPLFITMWVVFIILAWKDLRLIKLLERGFTPKG